MIFLEISFLKADVFSSTGLDWLLSWFAAQLSSWGFLQYLSGMFSSLSIALESPFWGVMSSFLVYSLLYLLVCMRIGTWNKFFETQHACNNYLCLIDSLAGWRIPDIKLFSFRIWEKFLFYLLVSISTAFICFSLHSYLFGWYF